jgi:hypothetical protein
MKPLAPHSGDGVRHIVVADEDPQVLDLFSRHSMPMPRSTSERLGRPEAFSLRESEERSHE